MSRKNAQKCQGDWVELTDGGSSSAVSNHLSIVIPLWLFRFSPLIDRIKSPTEIVSGWTVNVRKHIFSSCSARAATAQKYRTLCGREIREFEKNYVDSSMKFEPKIWTGDRLAEYLRVDEQKQPTTKQARAKMNDNGFLPKM